jgi:hypothetical protein
MGRNGCSGTQQLLSEHSHFLARPWEPNEKPNRPGSKTLGASSEFFCKSPSHCRVKSEMGKAKSRNGKRPKAVIDFHISAFSFFHVFF